MGKLQTFFIQYDNPNNVYYAGTMVSGRVVVVLSEPMKLRVIRLELRGRARTHWTEHEHHGSGNNRRSQTVHYRGEEAYLNADVILFPPNATGDSVHIPSGNHEFRFSFQLPVNSPTSFEANYGQIRYHTKAVIDKPWKFDHTTKAPFTTISLVDLNADPLASTGYSATSSKTLGTMCCTAGDVHCDIILERRGFVPGENLALKVSVNNESSRKIHAVSAKLMQSIRFSAMRQSSGWFGGGGYSFKFDNRKVAVATSNESVESGDVREYDFSQTFVIPPIPPYLVTSGIIQIGYMLKISLDPSGPSFDIDMAVPITIGSIPLRQTFHDIQPAAPQLNYHDGGPAPSAPQGQQPGTAPPPPYAEQYPDLPPPSYETCAFGQTRVIDDEDNEHTGGDLNYAPKYPVYGFSHLY